MSELDDNTTPAPQGSRVPTVALTAIVLSLCALFVSVLEVSSIRSEQRVGVWPYIDLASGYNEEGFRILATNKGIGPARVRSIKLLLDGKTQVGLDPLIQSVMGPDRAFSYDVYKSSNPARSVLSPDESSNLFSVPWTDDTRAFVEALTNRFSIELCYCSVYDDCWLAILNEGEPAQINSCP